MLKRTNLQFETVDGAFVISHKGTPIIKLTVKDLASHLEELGYQRVISEDDKEDEEVKVDQFIRCYFAEKKKFYGSSALARGSVTKKSKDYRHFKEALKIIDAHNISFVIFLKAQIKGLSFVQGTGKFPTPNQLSTNNAEERLLSFLRDNGHLETSQVPTGEDAVKAPLTTNEAYKRCIRKINEKTASYEEAKYAALCQKHHKGMIRPEVRDYLSKTRSNDE